MSIGLKNTFFMVVKSQIKWVKSLQQKRYRNREGLFVAEGVKLVRELLESHFAPRHIFTTDVSVLIGYSDEKKGHSDKIQQVSERELQKMSGLASPNTVIGIFEIAVASRPDTTDWILALDDIRDPGNLGTIIRLCDWFGIEHLVCSLETVDCYNPKVLQATMGSIARVQVGYTDLDDFLATTELPVFGAFMDGKAVHSATLPERGNSGHGQRIPRHFPGGRADDNRKDQYPASREKRRRVWKKDCRELERRNRRSDFAP